MKKKNETKKSIKNIVCIEGALTRIGVRYLEKNGNPVINLNVCVENTKGYSFINVVIFKESYNGDIEQLVKDLESIEIPLYDKEKEDYFKDYLPRLENVYIEGEISSNTFQGKTLIQVIANVVK